MIRWWRRRRRGSSRVSEQTLIRVDPPPVRASLLAMAICQSHQHWPNIRYREQARSHIGFGLAARLLFISRFLWERACSRWLSVSHINIGRTSAIASRLAPTLVPGWRHDCYSLADSCGSELARDGYLSVTSTLAEHPLSRAGSLPHWLRAGGTIAIHQQVPVGASLLAIAACQSTLKLADTGLSRADPFHRFAAMA